jgi:hypothetical protein
LHQQKKQHQQKALKRRSHSPARPKSLKRRHQQLQPPRQPNLQPVNQAKHSNLANHQVLIATTIIKLQLKMTKLSAVFLLSNHVMHHVSRVNQVDVAMLVIN